MAKAQQLSEWDIAAQFLTSLDKLGVVTPQEHAEIRKRILKGAANCNPPEPQPEKPKKARPKSHAPQTAARART